MLVCPMIVPPARSLPVSGTHREESSFDVYSSPPSSSRRSRRAVVPSGEAGLERGSDIERGPCAFFAPPTLLTRSRGCRAHEATFTGPGVYTEPIKKQCARDGRLVHEAP